MASVALATRSCPVEWCMNPCGAPFTMSESIDLKRYAIERMVNHKMGGDVTAG